MNMAKRIIASFILVLFLAGCQGLKSQQQNGAIDSVDGYNRASEGLEAFTLIPNDPSGARASDRVFFAFDSATLDGSAQKTLNRQVEWLKKNSDVSVTVEGHCDERGTREYNLALGERRAAASKRYLVEAGVGTKRISTISYGKERPAVVGSNDNAWALNRRAVTVLNNQ